MDQNAQLAAEIRAWMLRVMEEKGLNPATWAKAAGVARTTIARPVKEGYAFVTSSRTLAKLAQAVGADAPDFRQTAQAKIVPLYLPVRHRVQAGHWIEVDLAEQDFPAPPKGVRPDDDYAEWPQWLELVVGDSVDREIPPGHFAHVVDAIEMGYSPIDGDFVVVERRRDQGRLRERSIKQIAIREGRVELWPRSHNPAWDKPLELSAPGEGVEVELVGLVIGAYRGMR
ncbi:LexA family protein [Phenylobacterium kunshanense]|uniref:LexA family protein n=1 Tax=Phenylobacterium kunshanense TaxID=1445034 RepID=UPI0010575FFE|nr:S24 family peptidase [Phenylobacterium kunshanense]